MTIRGDTDVIYEKNGCLECCEGGYTAVDADWDRDAPLVE